MHFAVSSAAKTSVNDGQHTLFRMLRAREKTNETVNRQKETKPYDSYPLFVFHCKLKMLFLILLSKFWSDPPPPPTNFPFPERTDSGRLGIERKAQKLPLCSTLPVASGINKKF